MGHGIAWETQRQGNLCAHYFKRKSCATKSLNFPKYSCSIIPSPWGRYTGETQVTGVVHVLLDERCCGLLQGHISRFDSQIHRVVDPTRASLSSVLISPRWVSPEKYIYTTKYYTAVCQFNFEGREIVSAALCWCGICWAKQR